MKKKPFNPLMIGAVVLALFAVYLVVTQFNKIQADNAIAMAAQEKRLRAEFEKAKPGEVIVAQKEKTRPVVYAKVQIKPSDKIEATMLEVKETPENLIISAYERPEDVVGKYAMSGLGVGDPVLTSAVSSQVLRMSVKLTPGMRAITLPVENARSVGGFVTDGDRVDMMLTYTTGEKPPNREPTTRTVMVLQYVKVLYTPGPDDYRTEQTRPVKTRPGGDMITFEVTPDQSEMLIQLSQMGVFRLILRNRDDEVQWRTKGYSSAEFFDDDSGAQRRANRSVQAATDIADEIRKNKAEQPGGAPNAKPGNP